jgi:tetratricopeptide (TPR) repeat protein
MAERASLVARDENLRLDEAALIVKVLILMKMGRFDEALFICDALVSLDGSNAEAHFRRSQVLVSLNCHQDALVAARRATQYDADHFDAWVLQGDLLMAAGVWDEAYSAYTNAITCGEPDQYIQTKLGRVLCQLGWYEESLVVYEQAIRLDPASPLVAFLYICKGMALLSLGMESEAFATFGFALQHMETDEHYGVKISANAVSRHMGVLSSSKNEDRMLRGVCVPRRFTTSYKCSLL